MTSSSPSCRCPSLTLSLPLFSSFLLLYYLGLFFRRCCRRRDWRIRFGPMPLGRICLLLRVHICVSLSVLVLVRSRAGPGRAVPRVSQSRVLVSFFYFCVCLCMFPSCIYYFYATSRGTRRLVNPNAPAPRPSWPSTPLSRCAPMRRPSPFLRVGAIIGEEFSSNELISMDCRSSSTDKLDGLHSCPFQ